MSEKITVPTLGESVTEATVSKWLKSKGEKVNADEPIVELETDKVNVEVPSPTNGVIGSIAVKEGETVNVGSLLGTVDSSLVNNKKENKADSNNYSPPKREKDEIRPKIFEEELSTVPSNEPTFTVSPSFTAIFPSTPLVGEGTSTFTLSVSNSTKGSSAETLSPCDLSHLETVASETDSPSVGTVIFSAI